jgi:hypothetical protein
VLDTIRGGYRVLGIMYDDYIIMKFWNSGYFFWI